jgi:hypothetical protein
MQQGVQPGRSARVIELDKIVSFVPLALAHQRKNLE